MKEEKPIISTSTLGKSSVIGFYEQIINNKERLTTIVFEKEK